MFPTTGAKKPKGNANDTKLPKIRPNDDSSLDINMLDFDAEDFLSRLKKATDNNQPSLWKETCNLAYQLKASRELLTIGSHIFTNKTKGNLLDRIIDVTSGVLHVERAYLFQVDSTGKNLVITHTKDKQNIGIKIPIDIGIEGTFKSSLDVFILELF
jgi:hypothetical protein